MGQHVNTFMQQLRTKGFKDHYLGIGFEGAKGMEGTFAGYNAAVTIYSTPKSKLVDYVSAGFFMFTHGIHDYGAGKKLESMSLGYMESLVSR